MHPGKKAEGIGWVFNVCHTITYSWILPISLTSGCYMLQLTIVLIIYMDKFMKKIVPLILSTVLLTGCMTAHSGSLDAKNPINFPDDLLVDQIKGKQCVVAKTEGLPPKDLAKINANKLFENDTSLTVNHDGLSDRWSELLRQTYKAEATNNKRLAQDVVATLVYIAKAEALLSTRKFGNSGCWGDGDKNATCHNHTPQHTSFTFMAMMYSAIILKEHMTENDQQILSKYFKKAYNKFVKAYASASLHDNGFYEWGDGGMGVLAYAHWTNDKNLAYKEIKIRRNSMLKTITKDGYINNNSFRGNRGYWYHTLGANSMFGYAIMARSFGVDLFKDEYLGPKLKLVALRTLEGNQDYSTFKNLKSRGNNASLDSEDARPHMHQMAVSLPSIMASEFGMAVNPRPDYKRKVKYESIDKFIGFNADCYYSSK
tara:strand:- start:1644 stop:2927 length:1284 start_codon:yes stop_codon:yes gene_type:complete